MIYSNFGLIGGYCVKNNKSIYIVFSIICIGIPFICFVLSIFTGNWQFFYYGLIATFLSSVPSGLYFVMDYLDKLNKNKKR